MLAGGRGVSGVARQGNGQRCVGVVCRLLERQLGHAACRVHSDVIITIIIAVVVTPCPCITAIDH